MKNWQVIFIVFLLISLVIIFRKKIMFLQIVKIILRHEGGYVNDPDDAGGETKYGISHLNFPNVDIKNLTREQAIEIYRMNYYIPMEVDKVNPPNLALQYMDMGVNAGINTAKRLMEQAKEIKKTSSDSLLFIYKDLRRQYYQEVAKRRNNQKYLAGWLNRINSNIA